ncbi:MAG: hypothetical protein K2O83_11400, partial [Schaedlerella arabinosiphila]|nr:hypothetical protein [Schaedlerella arabinosiphila]
MKRNKRGRIRKSAVLCLAGAAVLLTAACGDKEKASSNLIKNDEKDNKVVNLFGPMEKTKPNAKNAARSAFDLTVAMAEEQLGLIVEYRTYTADDYQDKTYDDVGIDRVRNDMDDLYLLNPDTIQILGSEGELLDLS